MRLLLETHVAIWALAFPHRLTSEERSLIADDRNEIHVSAVSLWEISIKHALGRVSAPPFSAREALAGFHAAGYAILAMSAAHAVAVETLPALHGDPFDRMLVAQALIEPMRLVTHDRVVAAYSDTIMFFSEMA